MNTWFNPLAPIWPKQVTITGGIVNTHTHPRDLEVEGDGRAECFMPYYNGIYTDVIGIGNTAVPLTTQHLGLAQKDKWQSLTTARVHVAGLMTEHTTPEAVIAAYDRPSHLQAFLAMKMFLRAVSNSNGHDVDDVRRIIPVIKAMSDTKNFKHRKKPMVCKIHCERKWTLLGRRIPVIDRERIAIERDLEFILQEVPEAVIEICHVSDGATIEAIDYYRGKGFKVSGEISPHYGQYCVDDLFEDGNGGTALNSHRFCLPIFKSSKDVQIINGAMTSGKPWYHFGNDEACHNDDPTQAGGVKTNRKGITLGGQTQIPEEVISFVIEEFVKAGRVEYLSDFLCNNARLLYDLPASDKFTTFEHRPHLVATSISKELETKTITCTVAMGGQERQYALAA